MKFLAKKIEKLYDKKISAIGLGIFRIFYGLLLFAEVAELYYFRHLVFDTIPYLSLTENSHDFILLFWLGAILFIVLGLFTRTATIVNYAVTLLTFSTFVDFEYHLDYAMIGVNFLLLFIPISQVLSIDNLREKLRYSKIGYDYTPNKQTSVLYYYIFILIGVGLVYFDSIFWKFGSDMWLNGLGVWLPSSLPQNTWLNLSFLLDIKFIIIFFGYVTLVFELFFLFLFPFKQARIPLLIVGLGLHIGILFAFPIPWFALGVVTVYLLIVPVSWYHYLFNLVKVKKPRLIFFYDKNCPLCNRMRIIVKHFDFLNAIRFRDFQTYQHKYKSLSKVSEKQLQREVYSLDRNRKLYKGFEAYQKTFIYVWFLFPIIVLLKIPGISHIAKYIYNSSIKNKKTHCLEEECSIGFQSTSTPLPYDDYLLFNGFTWKKTKVKWWTLFIGFCICTQLISIGGSSLVSTQFFQATGNESLLQKIRSFTGPYLKTTTKFFGLTPHPVFMDNIHFSGYNHIIALAYVNADGTEEWLPIINEDGQAGYYNFGRRWVNWTFRVNSPSIVPNRLNLGIRRYSAFWSHKKQKSLRNATFKVKVKKIRSPNGWEKGFYNEQSNQPWIEAGEARWTNNQFTISIPNIETL